MAMDYDRYVQHIMQNSTFSPSRFLSLLLPMSSTFYVVLNKLH
jgi:hypothetical protein